MNNDVPQQQENGERPGWFLSWLKEVFLPQQRDPVEEQLEKFSDALESIPILDDSVRQTLATTLNHEARVGGARQQDRLKIKEILKTQAIPAVEPGVGMPWSKISDAEAKIISRALENLKIQDFSVKSLKHWISFYQDVFDKGCVHSRVGRLAIIYNSCSICLKNRLTGLGVGEDANEDSYTFLNLLQLITTIVHSPDAHDLAVMLLHDGIKQSASESVQSFLEKFKDAGEEAYGPCSNWNMSQASLIMKKICKGLDSSELSRLAASIVVSIPFNWASICDSLKQFQMRVKISHPQQNVHAIAVPSRDRRKLVCYRCSADHLLKD